jgi:uncharacterized protein (DUF1800 family)
MSILNKISCICVSATILLICGAWQSTASNTNELNRNKFPYAKAGLSERQAAEHLLSRFTYGVRKSDIDAALAMGLEKWFDAQLEAKANDAAVIQRLSGYESLTLTNGELINKFPKAVAVRKMALDDGTITKDELKNADQKDLNKKLLQYRLQKGLRVEGEMHRELIHQKILLATYSNNQLQQVMTDFWFNHFNVSLTKNTSSSFVTTYERDAIRPNTLGKFETLLIATAKHPAMLTYLDNFTSIAPNEMLQKSAERRKKNSDTSNNKIGNKLQNRGLNENYAREVMELHTLGVDGGYTQKDVTEAARILTGWTIRPNREIKNNGVDKLMQINGSVREGDFMFVNALHDNKPKQVMGQPYTQGGMAEGMALLSFLAQHDATAKFICKKLATKFVNDQPSEGIVAAMAKSFKQSGGHIATVLLTMVQHDGFWDKAALRSKTKSPFEYAISAMRSLEADIQSPQQISLWITKMGQRMYYYQAPTGFPDKAQYWINTGSLLNRMNFGLATASKRIPGISFNLAALNNNHEPESAEDALKKYAKILLPERDLETTYKRLTPLIQNENISDKISKASEKYDTTESSMSDMEAPMETIREKVKKKIKQNEPTVSNFGDNSVMAQVVGIILGSPEFQRR